MKSQSKQLSDHYENQNQQEEQEKISELKKQIEINHHKIHELMLDQQTFINKISNFNNKAKAKIQLKTQFSISQALIYLKQAQKVLEYAASSGKNINRQLIVCVLHNQACIYQILWQLQQCSNYLDALIYNYETYLKQTEFASCSPSYINQSTQNHTKSIPFEGSQISLSPSIIRKQATALGYKIQLRLVNYYFQHCAVSSQLQNNLKALQSARKSSRTIKNLLISQKNLLKQEICYHEFANNFSDTNQSRIQLLLHLSDYGQRQKINLSNFKQFFKSAHFSLQIWADNKTHNEMTSNLQSKQKLKCLAIGSIMQIVPKYFNIKNQMQIYQKMSQNQEIKQNIKLDQNNDIFSLPNYVLQVFFLSVSYFSIATQLRLVANNIYKKREQEKKNSQQYKQSIMYHLLAIIVATGFIPYESKYIQDILGSYSKHYNCNLEEYKPVQAESLQKISILLGFPSKQKQTDKKNKQNGINQCKQIQKNEYNLKFKAIPGKKKKSNKQKEVIQKQQKVGQNQNLFVQNNIKKSRSSRLNSQSSKCSTINVKKSHSKSISQKLQSFHANTKNHQLLKSPKLQKLIKNKSNFINAKNSQQNCKNSNYQQKRKSKNKNNTHEKIKQKQIKENKKSKLNQKKSPRNNHNPKVVSQDEEFFIYVSKKTTKLNQNIQHNMHENLQSPKNTKQSYKSTSKSRKSNKSTNVSSPKSPNINTVNTNFCMSGIKLKKINNSKNITSPRKVINIDRHYF